jgi:translation initiation factor 2 subunit 1
LYKKHGHAFEAFKIVVTDPDSVFDALTREVKETGPDGVEVTTLFALSSLLYHCFNLIMKTYNISSVQVTKVVPAVSEELKDAFLKDIRRRMTPQPMKIRADIELKCFQFDGVLHIKEAMKKAEAVGTDDCPVKIKLVAPPLYVLTTHTHYKEKGIVTLNKAIEACITAIEEHKGKLVVKEGARAVSERDDKLLAEHMAKLRMDNEEMSGDEGSEDEEEDTGMGEVDIDGGSGIIE